MVAQPIEAKTVEKNTVTAKTLSTREEIGTLGDVTYFKAKSGDAWVLIEKRKEDEKTCKVASEELLKELESDIKKAEKLDLSSLLTPSNKRYGQSSVYDVPEDFTGAVAVLARSRGAKMLANTLNAPAEQTKLPASIVTTSNSKNDLRLALVKPEEELVTQQESIISQTKYDILSTDPKSGLS